MGNKRVKLAPAEVVLALLGYPAGGVPPSGHKTTLLVLVDAILTLEERFGGVIYGGGGDDRTIEQLRRF